jgi:hypothetical protein
VILAFMPVIGMSALAALIGLFLEVLFAASAFAIFHDFSPNDMILKGFRFSLEI